MSNQAKKNRADLLVEQSGIQESQLPKSIQRGLSRLRGYYVNLEEDEAELAADPDDAELKESLDESRTDLTNYENDLVEDLEEAIAAIKAKNPVTPPAGAPPAGTPSGTPPVEKTEEESSGSGFWVALTLTVLTLGGYALYKRSQSN